MDERLVRKREEEEQLPEDGGDTVPPELIQLAGLLLQSFLAGDRESVEALYEMYHEPDKFVERQRNAIKQMLKELLADGTITAEQAKQVEKELSADTSADGQTAGNKPAGDESATPAVAETPLAQTQDGDTNGKLQIPADAQRINPKGKTLHEILGITR